MVVRFSRYELCVTLSMVILLLLGLSCLGSLSAWQWMRAQEKQHLLTSEAAQRSKPFQLWQAQSPLPAPYQRVRLQGQYGKTIFWLDNQYHKHQWGYHVLTPLRVSAHQWVMVDRGWIAGGHDRRLLPAANIPQGPQELWGTAYYPAHNRWIPSDILERRPEGLLIGQIDPAVLSVSLKRHFLPFIVRLDPAAPGGFIRIWPVVSMSPARHIGYAVQWFCLALLFAGSVIVYHVKRLEPEELK